MPQYFPRPDAIPTAYATGAKALGQRNTHRTQCYELELQSVLAHTSTGVMASLTDGNMRVASQGRRGSAQYVYPAAYTGPQIDVFVASDGLVTTQYDNDQAFRNAYMVKADNLGAVGNKTYWVSPSGDNSDGTTPAKAYTALTTAVAKADVLTIMIDGGTAAGNVYTWHDNPGKSINFIRYGTGPVLLYKTPPVTTFTVNATYANVYELDQTLSVERPLSGRVRDEHGVPLAYTEVASVAAVSNQPLSYYLDETLHILYVHHGIGAPVIGVDIFVTLRGYFNHVIRVADNNANTQLFIEGLYFLHGVSALSTTGGELRMLNCAGTAGQTVPNQVPFTISGVNTVFKRCIAAYSSGDGMSYTDGTGIELDCVIYANGDGGSSVQASSCHLTTKMLRIRGKYENASQNCILDVGSGETVNIGVKAKGGATSSCIGVGETRKMWCIDCVTAGNGNHYLGASTVAMQVDGNMRGIRVSATGGVGVVIADAA